MPPLGIGSFFSEVYYKLRPRRKGKSVDLPASIYDFTVNSLTGKPVKLDQFKGKPLLIVNTASKCGYTYQYEGLEKLHEKYGDRVTILGFPANDFLWQEPGSNEEIASFCQVNYGVTFPMFEKISVKGKEMHPLFRWLESKTGKSPVWNFCKYLVSPTGEQVDFFSMKVEPMDKRILSRLGIA